MLIADTWAYGHIPKTGGDAIHLWFDAIRRPGWIIDSTSVPEKHQGFLQRPSSLNKQIYALSFRRLPSWTLSFLHELTYQPAAWARYGFTSKEEICRPETALRYHFADEELAVFDGVVITHWLRMEYLITDFLRFAEEILGPLSAEEIAGIKAARTKGVRNYNHDVSDWWAPEEIEKIYELNPRWAGIEEQIYRTVPEPDPRIPDPREQEANSKPEGGVSGRGRNTRPRVEALVGKMISRNKVARYVWLTMQALARPASTNGPSHAVSENS